MYEDQTPEDEHLNADYSQRGFSECNEYLSQLGVPDYSAFGSGRRDLSDNNTDWDWDNSPETHRPKSTTQLPVMQPQMHHQVSENGYDMSPPQRHYAREVHMSPIQRPYVQEDYSSPMLVPYVPQPIGLNPGYDLSKTQQPRLRVPYISDSQANNYTGPYQIPVPPPPEVSRVPQAPVALNQFGHDDRNRQQQAASRKDLHRQPSGNFHREPHPTQMHNAPRGNDRQKSWNTPAGSYTTLMIRNIPNKYTQRMLLQVWIEQGFSNLFDFFYLPIDFRNKCNVGYAFINFISPEYAERFKNYFQGFKLGAFKSNKVVEVTLGRVQGLHENVKHFRNSAVMSSQISEEYKPMLFNVHTGEEILFPNPDGPLPEIKLRPVKHTGSSKSRKKT